MRTTLNIEDDALLVIRKYAEDREISLGQAASDLVNRGAQSIPQFQIKNGWVILDLPSGNAQISNEMLDELEKAGYEQEFQRAVSPRR
jgi:hypothetical protein